MSCWLKVGPTQCYTRSTKAGVREVKRAPRAERF